ncbi:type IV secretory system conjugative DNA transfer family protein, partial [Paracoccus acridae]|uniref:type IV secretory system conjugative DNA transfer family protein n=1 Tax=Paracoccus acridae TaxID=1795310 RepID=UPI001E50912A
DGQGLLKRSVSRRNEERPLMTPDEVRRLDPDKILLIPERQNPILVDRIVYYEDAWFKTIIDAQKGPLPYPDRLQAELEDLRAEVMALKEDRILYPDAEPWRDGVERSETEPPLAQDIAETHKAEADDAVIEEPDFQAASDKMDRFDSRLRSKARGGQDQANPTVSI